MNVKYDRNCAFSDISRNVRFQLQNKDNLFYMRKMSESYCKHRVKCKSARDH